LTGERTRTLQIILAALAALAGGPWSNAAAPPAPAATPSPAADSSATASGEPATAQALPSDAELERSGAVIGEVLVDNQNIFNTEDRPDSRWLFRLANHLHVRTRANVIRSQLLFRPGDRYSRRLLEESERILRTAVYFYDASIRPVRYHDGRVDVSVTTRDVWTFNPGASYGRQGGTNSTGVSLEELNFLGSGAAVQVAHSTTVDRTGNAIQVIDPHAFDTWTAVTASYANNSDGYSGELAANRPFYALDVRRAYGIDVLENHQIDSLYDRGDVVDEFNDHHTYTQGYLGFSPGLQAGWVQRFSVGATVDDHEFSPTPTWTLPTLLPEDRKFTYPWVEYDLVQDDFIKLRNHDQIERTEDFYMGTQLGARVGWADPSFGADRSALMLSGYGGTGFGMGERTVLLLATTFSGRLESGALRNGVATGSARLYREQSTHWLFFASLQGTLTHQPDLDNQVLLGGDSGLRGYPLRYQGGTASGLLTLEERYFSNWYPFRLFHVGAAIFVDSGRTWGSTPLTAPNLGMLEDVGCRLRFGSARSGLGNVIHVDVAVPLQHEVGVRSVQFLVVTQQRF